MMPSSLKTKPAAPEAKQTTLRAVRSQLQDVIAETDDDMLAPLMEALQPLDIKVLMPPAAGLIMMKVISNDGTVFHLGEVLVTEAQISCDGVKGYGCCMGERFDAAVALASLDALAQVEPPECTDALRSAIHRICRQVCRQREVDAQMTAVTRVDFHSMAEE